MYSLFMAQVSFNLQALESRLRKAGVIAPLREAERIVRHELGLTDDCVPLPTQLSLEEAACERIDGMAQKREARVPFERLAGTVTFEGVEIDIAPDVFKPYPESRAVVEHAAILLEARSGPPRLLDLGCGTGCLLLALLLALPEASGVGIDLSPACVALAQKNAQRNGLQERADFRQASWLDDQGELFDFAIANPPRVPSQNIAFLIPEMRDHDPHLALDGGADGLAFYKAMAERLPRLVKAGGHGLFQISPSQTGPIQAMFVDAGFAEITIKKNYMGFPCAVMAKI